MTRLEQVKIHLMPFDANPESSAWEILDRDEAIAAARLDTEDAYRRGVEDSLLGITTEAWRTVQPSLTCHERAHVVLLGKVQDAYGGVIRQRLERLKEGNGNG